MKKPSRILDGFFKGCRRRPTLPHPLGRSTIGAAGLNDRVRNGNGCGPCALVASEFSLSKKMTKDCSSDRVMFESTVRSLGFLLVGFLVETI
jgi:hypothetical protein